MVDRLRLASRAHLATGLRSPVADVLQGMVLGDDEGVPEQIVDDFRRSGLLHIMAVSGENVVLLCAMWGFALMLFGVPRLARTLALLPIVATLRAPHRGLAVDRARRHRRHRRAARDARVAPGRRLAHVPRPGRLAADRQSRTTSSTSASSSRSPRSPVCSCSRARSRTRCASCPAPWPNRRASPRRPASPPRPCPMLTFGSTSVVAVAANVAGGFVLGPIMFLGMLSLLAGFVTSWLSLPLNVVAGLFIGFLLEVSRFFGRLSFAVYEWQGLTFGLMLTGAAVAELVALRVLAGRDGTGLCGVRDAGAAAQPRDAVSARRSSARSSCWRRAPPRRRARRRCATSRSARAPRRCCRSRTGPPCSSTPAPSRSAGASRRSACGASISSCCRTATPITPPASPTWSRASRWDRPCCRRRRRRRRRWPRSPPSSRPPACRCRGVPRPWRSSGDGWRVRILPTRPPPGEAGNQGENDCALVVLVEIGGHRLLVPGDAEGEVLADLELPSVRRGRAAASRQPRRHRRRAARAPRPAARRRSPSAPTSSATRRRRCWPCSSPGGSRVCAPTRPATSSSATRSGASRGRRPRTPAEPGRGREVRRRVLSFGSRWPSAAPSSRRTSSTAPTALKVRRAVTRLRRRVVAESGSDLNVDDRLVAARRPSSAPTRVARRRSPRPWPRSNAELRPRHAARPRRPTGTAGRRTNARRSSSTSRTRCRTPSLAVEGETFGKDDAWSRRWAACKQGQRPGARATTCPRSTSSPAGCGTAPRRTASPWGPPRRSGCSRVVGAAARAARARDREARRVLPRRAGHDGGHRRRLLAGHRDARSST